MDKPTWKDKHEKLLKNKDIIIDMYNDKIPMEEIGIQYSVTGFCIHHNLKSWGVIRKHGIKYLLGKLI